MRLESCVENEIDPQTVVRRLDDISRVHYNTEMIIRFSMYFL